MFIKANKYECHNSNKFNRASNSEETENLPKLKLVKPSNSSKSPSSQQFDRPVILQQAATLSRLILLFLLTVTTRAIAGACIAKIEQAITATGKLEPTGTVKEVKSSR